MTTQTQTPEQFIKSYFEGVYGDLTFRRKGHTNLECENRQIYFYCMTLFTRLSLKKIGNSLGKRFDHTTVIYSKKKISGLMKSDKNLKLEVEKHCNFIEQSLTPHPNKSKN